MGAPQVGLRDVVERASASRLRLLAPLRYLAIRHPEKDWYDFGLPVVIGVAGWIIYAFVKPRIPLFGDDGLLRFARDLLVMGVPFMVGALAAVSMGGPGAHLDRRPAGADLCLAGRVLTMRQFLCYLLGYLSFLGFVTLGAVVLASLGRETIIVWTDGMPVVLNVIRLVGSLVLSLLFSFLTITVLWSLYFLTDVANRT